MSCPNPLHIMKADYYFVKSSLHNDMASQWTAKVATIPVRYINLALYDSRIFSFDHNHSMEIYVRNMVDDYKRMEPAMACHIMAYGWEYVSIVSTYPAIPAIEW